MTGHPQAMSAERIEKAARAFDPTAWTMPSKAARDYRQKWACLHAEAILRAAYPELADGSSVILPREASEAMLSAGAQGLSWREVLEAMRDAALSAPEST